ncbi:MAG TPA: ASCH domain-containing protein [Polyangiaceae bacterium]
MHVDPSARDATWRAYVSELPPDHPHRRVKPDAFAFGDEPAIADELAALVVAGRKRATTSLPIEFTALNEPLPRVGDVSIIVRGDGVPVAIIERTQVITVPFDAVDATYAAIEGEGDGSLAYFREAHTEYFTGVCARLGGRFEAQTPVLCQIFRVLWTSPGGSR